MSSNESDQDTTVSREKHEQEVRIHKDSTWGYVQAYARSCDYIGKTFGDEALRQFHIETGLKRAHPALKMAVAKGADKFMKTICRTMNINGDFVLEETEGEIIVSGKCGSGGRWIREGHTAKNKEGVPYYCVHCPIWWEEMPKEFGLKMTFHRSGKGDNCAWKVKKE